VSLDPLYFIAGIKHLGAGQEGKARHRFALSDGELWLTGVPASQIQHLVPDNILYTNVIVRLNDYIFNTVNNKKYESLTSFHRHTLHQTCEYWNTGMVWGCVQMVSGQLWICMVQGLDSDGPGRAWACRYGREPPGV
jgi:hypothetical protein